MSTLSKPSFVARCAVPFFFFVISLCVSTSVITKCVALASAIIGSSPAPVPIHQVNNIQPHHDQVENSLSCNPDDNTCHPGREGYVYSTPGDLKSEGVNTELRMMQLALARICVSEAGFQIRTRDCEFIYHALRNRSRTGELNLGIMRAYAPKSFNRRRTDSHRWIAHLTHRFDQPKFWQETTTIPWSRRVAGYRQVYEFAGRLVQTRPSSPCGVRIDHWAAQHFRRRRLLRSGWRIVECGETLNTFWTLPDRRPSRSNDRTPV